MKKIAYGFAFLATTLAQANEVDKEKVVVAVESTSQTPVTSGTLLTTGSREKNLVDRDNMKIILGPQSVAEFNGKGVFRLLRGSANLESPTEREFYTTNATVRFVGRMLVSFDHAERSTSSFVLSGEARVQNPFETERTIIISRHQGASLVTGEVYPTLVRGLDLAQVDEWLKGYHWNTGRRAALLQGVPKADEIRSLIAEKSQELEAENSPEGRVGQKQNPLSDYFASVYEQEAVPERHEEYKAIEDKAEKVAVKEPEVILSPEHAAIIPLPETKISSDFDILSQEDATLEKKLPPQEVPLKSVTRKIASLPKVPKAAPRVLAPEEAAIARLRSIRRESGGPVSRAPASIGQSASRPQVGTSLVPDPVYDLSENF